LLGSHQEAASVDVRVVVPFAAARRLIERA
jgi:hypothetical protein